jgi:putative SOS response-associated peptidase YedK
MMRLLSTWRDFIAWDKRELEVEPATDVWPKRPALVVRRDEDDAHVPDVMHWGVPTSVPGKRPGVMLEKRVTNVRNLSSNFWRSMLVRPEWRCLVPFTTFAEPKIGAGREEHWFSIPSEPVAAFAGIWRPSTAGNVFAFLTCAPNPLVEPLHPKAMPVILHPDDYGRWLDCEDAADFAVPFPSQLMALT